MSEELVVHKGYTREDVDREAFCQEYIKDEFFGQMDGPEKACLAAGLKADSAFMRMYEPQTITRIKQLRKISMDHLPDDILRVAQQFKEWADDSEFNLRERKDCLVQYAKIMGMFEKDKNEVQNQFQQINNYINTDPSELADRIANGESIDAVVKSAVTEQLDPKTFHKIMKSRQKCNSTYQKNKERAKLGLGELIEIPSTRKKYAPKPKKKRGRPRKKLSVKEKQKLLAKLPKNKIATQEELANEDQSDIVPE